VRDADFVGEVLLQLEDLRGFDGLVAVRLFSALAGEDLDVPMVPSMPRGQ